MATFIYTKDYSEFKIPYFESSKEEIPKSLYASMLEAYIEQGCFAFQSSLSTKQDIYSQFMSLCSSFGSEAITDASRRLTSKLGTSTKYKLSSVDMEFPHVNPHSETSFSPAKPSLIAFTCLEISKEAASHAPTTLIDGNSLWDSLELNHRKELSSILISYRLAIDIPVKKRKSKIRDWYLDYSSISNSILDYENGKIMFDYYVPFVTEHPITRKLSIANHAFIDLKTEPQILSRKFFQLRNDILKEVTIPSQVLVKLDQQIKTFYWRNGLSLFIDNHRFMHGRLSYDMNQIRNIFIRQYKTLNFNHFS